MNKIFLTLILASVFLAIRAEDEVTPSLPTGPVLLRAPDFAHWKVTYTYDAPATPPPVPKPLPEGEPPPPLPVLVQEISVTKTGKIYHCETKFENGLDLDQWWVGGIVMARQKGQPDYSLLSGTNVAGIGFQSSDFPDLDWLNASSFSGVEVVDGAKCFVFKKQVLVSFDEIPRKGPEIRPTYERTIWVGVDSRLPVRESIPSRKADYRFLAPPDSMQDLPPEVAQGLITYKADVARMTRPAAKP